MIKVLVDARINRGMNGGIEQAIFGLAESFAAFPQEKICFTWLCYQDSVDALKPFLGKYDEIQVSPEPPKSSNSFANFLRKSKVGNKITYKLRKYGPYKFTTPAQPEIVSEILPDIIHFPTQYGFKTEIPSIYQPHDFQHNWYPDFFSTENLYLRDLTFAEMIEQASVVCVGNSWTLKDFYGWYPDSSEKGMNVPVYPRTLESTLPIVSIDLVDGDFIYYPAAFWSHKNHANLLKGFKLILEDHPKLKLVLTGSRINESVELRRLISALGLPKQVIVLGYLEKSEVAWLYSNAQIVVVPSKFESESLPIWEAFAFGTPVACSDITALPSQVGEAALLFNPDVPEEISRVVSTLLSNSELRRELSVAGLERYKKLTPQNTALGYFVAYSKALGSKFPEFEDIWHEHCFVF